MRNRMLFFLTVLFGIYFPCHAFSQDSQNEPSLQPRKARIAVVPAIYAQDARRKYIRELNEQLGITDPTLVENPGFTGHLVNALVHCRKFDVLERSALNDVIKEIDFGESDYADLSKSVRMGQMVNADYVLLPEIRFILFVREDKEIPYMPVDKVLFEGTMATNLRVVDVKTSRICSSNIGETAYQIRLERDPKDRLKQGLSFVDRMYEATATKEVSRIIDVVYPIKIIAVESHRVTLNRGSGAIQAGEILTVYKPGEDLIDPDTLEYLGTQEAMVGKVKVSQVTAKVSYAEVIEAAIPMETLFVCRRDREIETERPGVRPRVE